MRSNKLKNMKEIEKLHKKGLNDSQIAKKLSLTPSAIMYWRKKLNLKSNYKSEQRFNYNNTINENKQVKAALVGTLLGDASLHINNITKGNSATGSFHHCIDQKEYFYYKYEILKDICNIPFKKKGGKKYFKRDNRYINAQDQYGVNVKSNPNLVNLHKLLYKNGEKVITSKLLEDFNELSLALLYCDDGNKLYSKRGGVKYIISTCCFSTKSINIFSSLS